MFNSHPARYEQKALCTFPTTKLKNISCVFCRHQFYIRDLSHLKGVYLPLVLRCGHAGCQQCAAGHRGDPCPLCKTTVDFDRPEEENLPPANVYVIGLFGVARAQSARSFEADISFSQAMRTKQQSAKQESCFKCSAQAELRCLKCHDLLCHLCSSKIHSKLKAQGQHDGHFEVMLTDCSKDSKFEIRTCIEHENAALDYYCEDCNVSGCAHCMCDYHKPHNTMRQLVKNEEYMEDFQRAYDQLGETLQRIRWAQKKLKKVLVFPEELQNSETIEAAINQHFAHLHGVLQNIESDLIKDLYEQRTYIARNLTDIQQRLSYQEEQVQSGLLMAASINEFCGRVSLRDVIEKLEELADVPCHLIENPMVNDEKIMFTRQASVIETLENHCQLIMPKTGGYDLCTRDALPMDYKIEPISTKESPRLWDKSFSSETSLAANSSCQSLASSRRSEALAFRQKGYNLVQVCHIESPGNFYVRLAAHKHDILRLEDELAYYAEKRTRIPQTVQQNKIYAVKRTGGKWFRGRVKAINTSHGNADTYEVFNMDYGKTESRVAKSRIRCIPDQLAAIPQYVINCALHDIVPVNGKWGKEERRKMTEFFKTKDGRTANVYLYIVLSKENTYHVDICKAPTRDGEGVQVSIRDTLIFSGYGAFVTSQFLLRTCPSAVRKFFREDLALDTYHGVNCSHVDSPNCIFVQKTGLNLEHLSKLMSDLAKIYSAHTKSERLMIYVPEMGMPCAVEKAKGTWCRAVVCGIPAPLTVEVFLVDFGAKITTNYEKIRKLSANYMVTAGQAIRVSLADIKPSGGPQWSEAAIEFTREYVVRKDARVVAFEKNENGYNVALYINGDTNFAAVLTSSSYAVSTGPRSSGVVVASSGQPNPVAQTTKVRNSRTVKTKRHHRQSSKLPTKSGVETAETVADPYRVQVKVIRVESPNAIYLADPTQDAEHEAMMRQMQKFYNEYRTVAGATDWQVDFPCVVYSTCDRLYCRGKIVAINSANVAQVFLYDLAHTVAVPVEDLQTLKKRFWHTRTHAFKVRLAGLLPCGGSSEWTKTSCERLKDIVIENLNSKFFISKVENPEDDDLYVELWVEQVKIEGPLSPARYEINSINRMLVYDGLALPIRRQSEKKVTLAVELQRQISGAEREQRDEGFRFIGNEEDAESEGNSSKNSVAPSECTLVSNDEEEPTSWLPAEEIADDAFVAEPTYVDHDCVVHLHSIAQSRETLRSIEATLESEHSRLKQKPRDSEWKEGDMCIALYHADKKWHRAQVLGVQPNNIRVEFVDYGNIEHCESEALRLPETQSGKLAMTRIPRQCTKCVIHGLYLNPPQLKWRVYDLDVIHMLLVNQECEVSVQKRMKNHLVVTMFLLNPRRELIKYLVEVKQMDVLVDFGTDTNSGNETITLNETSTLDNSDDVIVDGYIIRNDNDGYEMLKELEKTEVREPDDENNFELPEITESDDIAAKIVEYRETGDSSVKKVVESAAGDADSAKIRENDSKTTATDINDNETDDPTTVPNGKSANDEDSNGKEANSDDLNAKKENSDDSNAKKANSNDSNAKEENSDDSNAMVVNDVDLSAKISNDADSSPKILNVADSSAKTLNVIDSSAKKLNDVSYSARKIGKTKRNSKSSETHEAEIDNDEETESTITVDLPTVVSASRFGNAKFPKDVPIYDDGNESIDSDDFRNDELATLCRTYDTVLSGTPNFTHSAGEIELSQVEAMDRLEIISLPDNNFLKDDDLVTSTPMNETLDCGLCLPYKPIVFPDSLKIVKAVVAVIGRTDSWLHILDNQNSEVVSEARAKYERIVADMQKRAAKQPIMKTYERGSPCCVKFKDGLWYRCFVADCESRPYKKGNFVKVTFGDWGNSEDVGYFELRAMKDEWLDAPFMSLRCRLWGVKEAPGAIDNDLSAKLWKAYGGNEEKIVYVELMGYSNHTYDVQIYNDESCTELIYDSLIREGLFVKKPTSRTD